MVMFNATFPSFAKLLIPKILPAKRDGVILKASHVKSSAVGRTMDHDMAYAMYSVLHCSGLTVTSPDASVRDLEGRMC